jgi:hypothetical protein
MKQDIESKQNWQLHFANEMHRLKKEFYIQRRNTAYKPSVSPCIKLDSGVAEMIRFSLGSAFPWWNLYIFRTDNKTFQESIQGFMGSASGSR